MCMCVLLDATITLNLLSMSLHIFTKPSATLSREGRCDASLDKCEQCRKLFCDKQVGTITWFISLKKKLILQNLNK